MIIQILKDFKGQEAGKPVQKYLAGTSYTIEDPELIKVIFAQKWGHQDVFASLAADTLPAMEATESEKEAAEYGLTEIDVLGLPMKRLKAIIEEEQFLIDAQGKKQAELAAAVLEALKLKYKGI